MALLVLGRSRAAEQVLDHMLLQQPGDAYALASRAHLRMQRHDIAGAILDAQALVERHPQRSAADAFNLGYLLEKADRLDEAEAAFRRALAMDPKLDRAWYGLAIILIRDQRLDEAAAALKRNTELQPLSPYGWYQLAHVHMDQHEVAEALTIIRHLHGFEPRFAEQLERETGLKA